MRLKVRAIYIGILFLMAGSAKGQFFQFVPPGGPDERPESVEERLDREIRDAPYRLGPVRIAPLVGFRDLAYVRDLFDSAQEVDADVTATVGAGFRAYLRTGRKVTWIAQALPEYVWWQEREDARRLNLSGGLETVFLFNRLTVDLATSRVEQQRIVTPELPVLVSTATDLARIDAELELTPQLRPFVSARRGRMESLADDRDNPRVARLGLLDRDEEVLRGGLHWYPRVGWKIGLGAERSQVDFHSSALDSSNEGTAPVLELVIDRPRVFFNANLAARSLEATEGSRFVDYDGVTGTVSLTLLPGGRLESALYGSRQILYSLATDSPYMEDQRLGVSLETRVGRRARFQVFAETGGIDYVTFARDAPERDDDLTAYGGSLRLTLADPLTVAFQVIRMEIDSNHFGFDRSYTSGGITLALRGNLAGRNL